ALLHSFPTRRSSDLGVAGRQRREEARLAEPLLDRHALGGRRAGQVGELLHVLDEQELRVPHLDDVVGIELGFPLDALAIETHPRSEEHTSELQSLAY